jgi:hypothetical protein
MCGGVRTHWLYKHTKVVDSNREFHQSLALHHSMTLLLLFAALPDCDVTQTVNQAYFSFLVWSFYIV